MKKKVLTLMLALCLMLSALPVNVLSEGEITPIDSVDAVVSEIGEGDGEELPDLPELPEDVPPEIEAEIGDEPVPEVDLDILHDVADSIGKLTAGLIDAAENAVFGTEDRVDADDNGDDMSVVDGAAEPEDVEEEAEDDVVSDDTPGVAELPDGEGDAEPTGAEDAVTTPEEDVLSGDTPEAVDEGESGDDQPAPDEESEAEEQPAPDEEPEAEEQPAQDEESAAEEPAPTSEPSEDGDEPPEAVTIEAEAPEETETPAETVLELSEAQYNAETPAETAEAAISLDRTSLSLPLQETVTLTASGGSGDVTWSTEDASVATVDGTGAVTAVALGATRVVAKDSSGAQTACEVTVVQVPEDIAFESGAFAIGLKEKRALPRLVWDGGTKVYHGTVTRYASSSKKKVTVTAAGMVKGISKGNAVITATLPDGRAVKCTVSVRKAPSKITLTPSKRSMGVGETLTLAYKLPSGSASGVTWSSSNAKVASVDAQTGLITANARGSAKITARTFNKKKASVKITVYAAPSGVVFNTDSIVVGLGEKLALSGYVSVNSGAFSNYSFATADGGIAKINGDTIVGSAVGETQVTAYTYNGLQATASVVVKPAPTYIKLPYSTLYIGKGERLQLQADLGDGASALRCTSSKKKIVKITADGKLYGVKKGTAYVTVRTFNNRKAKVKVVVRNAPKSLTASPKSLKIGVGETATLSYKLPSGSAGSVTFSGDAPSVFTVDAGTGKVTALSVGSGTITLKAYNGVTAKCAVTVYDTGSPSAVKLKSDDIPVLYVGDTWQAECVVTPESADATLTWTSSDANVATVDSTGLIQAVGMGQTTIKAVSARNESLSVKFTITVQTRDVTLTIPARTTDTSGIAANLELINAVKNSALSEIDRLKNAGTISSDSAAKRKTYVENIFKCYAFPWMTPSKQSYWKAANSENGAKDFKTGIVYYGMPYISGSGANRHYTPELALSEGRYTDSGAGYYLLNKSKHLNGKYVGNDCSGLVNVSIWGVKSSHASDRTSDIAVSSAYTTVSSYNNMLPGDLICKANAHVVMFLYYASADKTKIMIIENGGSEKGTNTVHCDIKTASAYKKSGYSVRRVAGL